MKRILVPSLIAIGGLALFAGAFIGFAHMRGASLRELPLVGGLFRRGAAPENAPDLAGTPEIGKQAAAPSPAPAQASMRNVRVASFSVLDAFSLASPYTTAELQELVDAWKRKESEADRRLAALAEKESGQAEREEALDEQQEELEKLRAELDLFRADLLVKAAELQKDLSARGALEDEAWKARGALFEEGEPEALASRLVTYEPAQAARLLVTLTPERARELLDALPSGRWRDYAEAYSLRVSEAPAKQ